MSKVLNPLGNIREKEEDKVFEPRFTSRLWRKRSCSLHLLLTREELGFCRRQLECQLSEDNCPCPFSFLPEEQTATSAHHHFASQQVDASPTIGCANYATNTKPIHNFKGHPNDLLQRHRVPASQLAQTCSIALAADKTQDTPESTLFLNTHKIPSSPMLPSHTGCLIGVHAFTLYTSLNNYCASFIFQVVL
jgi:hypothetical protein